MYTLHIPPHLDTVQALKVTTEITVWFTRGNTAQPKHTNYQHTKPQGWFTEQAKSTGPRLAQGCIGKWGKKLILRAPIHTSSTRTGIATVWPQRSEERGLRQRKCMNYLPPRGGREVPRAVHSCQKALNSIPMSWASYCVQVRTPILKHIWWHGILKLPL
jgi:hypothetical protein